jgi:ParB-like chromosome segregation protein Spo0J
VISTRGEIVLTGIEMALRNLNGLSLEERIAILNAAKLKLQAESPFKNEPVDCVQWIPAEEVVSNDYNPNSVAPPEMQLLEHSIAEDGYTQPIVAWRNGETVEVVDGFHRNRVGRECPRVAKRILGYLPVTIINPTREDRGDRIAATIRHNRARGKHRVDSMSEIVVELKRRNWTNERICKELGMEPDEVLRLCQITGLAELFSDQDFSASWDVEGQVSDDDFQQLYDDINSYADEVSGLRTVNTSDPSRIFHTHDKWECYRAGFYASTKDGMTKEECEEAYRAFLVDLPRFEAALVRVTTEWKHSCEHYLTNRAMNRIAWLGQASACIEMGIPATFRGGFHRLTEEQQAAANASALIALNHWLEANGLASVSLEDAMSGRQSGLY